MNRKAIRILRDSLRNAAKRCDEALLAVADPLPTSDDIKAPLAEHMADLCEAGQTGPLRAWFADLETATCRVLIARGANGSTMSRYLGMGSAQPFLYRRGLSTKKR